MAEGFDKIWEVCPHCEQEVELKPEMKIQVCPECGKWICPCSMCDCNLVECQNCELEKQAHQLNEKL